MNRHLVLAVCTFIICGLISFVLPVQIPANLLFLFSVILIVSIITAKLKHRFSTVLLCSFFAVLSLLLCLTIHLPNMQKTKQYAGNDKNITAEVLTINKMPYYTTAVVKAHTINEEKTNVKILVSNFFLRDVKEGDIVNITGDVSSSFSKSFNFNSQNYNAARKIFLKMSATSIRKTDVSPNALRNALYDFRLKCFEAVDPLENSHLIRALTIGDKSLLPAEIKSDFETLGLSHALAVSGMHLSLLVMSLYLFLHKHSVNKKLLAVVCSFCVLFYMALTGFSFSIIRAGIMMIVYFLSLLSRRQNDGITSLFASLLFITVENPLAIFDVGLQLSFASTLGILALASPVIKKLADKLYTKKPSEKVFKWRICKMLKGILMSLCTSAVSSVCATLFSLPLLCIHFRSFTVFSIVANVTIIFLINYLLIVSIIHIILYLVFSNFLPIVLVPTKIICNFLSGAVIKSCAFLAHILPSPLVFTSELSIVIAIICAVITAVFLFLAKNFKTLSFYTLLVLSFVIFLVFSEKSLFFKDPVVMVSTSKSCKDVLIEDGPYTVLISDDRDKTLSTPLFEMLDFRAVNKIDKAVFFITNEIPTKKIENILSVYTVDEFVFVPASFDAYVYYPESIIKNSKISFVRTSSFEISENTHAELLYDDYYNVIVGKNDEAVITWCVSSEYMISPRKNGADTQIIFNPNDPESLWDEPSANIYKNGEALSKINIFEEVPRVSFVQLKVANSSVTVKKYE